MQNLPNSWIKRLLYSAQKFWLINYICVFFQPFYSWTKNCKSIFLFKMSAYIYTYIGNKHFMSWIRNPSYIFWDNFIHGKTHWNLLPQAFICTSMKSSTSYKKYCGKTTHACPIFHSILPQKFWAIISEVKEKYTEESRHYSMTKSSVLYSYNILFQ